MKKNLLRAVIALAVAVALAFGMEALQIATQPKLYTGETRMVKEPEVIVYGTCEQLENCEVDDDGMMKLSAGESSFVYRAPETLHLNKMTLEFKKTLKRDCAVTLLYAAGGEELTEERSVTVTAESGEIFAELELPEGDYTQLKFMFSTDKSATIRPVACSEGVEERVAAESRMQPGRIALLAGLLFAAGLCMIALGTGRFLTDAFRGGWRGITENKKRALIRLGLFILVGGAAWGLLRLTVPGIVGKDFNRMQNVFCILTAVCAASLFTFRETLGNKPEIFFLIFCLLIGSMYAFLLPPKGIGPDSAYHSMRAIQGSYLGELRQTEPEGEERIPLQEEDAEIAYRLGDARDGWLADLDSSYREGALSSVYEGIDTKSLWAIVPGAGVYLGRVLGLSFASVWSLGRFFNLFGFAVIGYFAIRRLKSGKMILTAVLMIPASLFLSSVYNYDAGFNALMALFCSYLIAEWQEPEKKLQWRNFWIMIVSFLIAGLTKAVYVPMILLMFLLPKEKYTGSRQRRGMTAIVFATIAVLLVSFLVPFLTGDGGGDERGGEGVNSFGQAMFILQNPLQYTGILLRFLKNYINFANADTRLGQLSELGTIANGAIYLALLAAVAFTDRLYCGGDLAGSRGRRPRRSPDGDGSALYPSFSAGTRCLGLVILFATVALFTSALYVSYNPVGSRTIAGVQSRYLYAVMFPAMILLAPGTIRNGMNRKTYNGIIFAVICYVNLTAVLNHCIALFG